MTGLDRETARSVQRLEGGPAVVDSVASWVLPGGAQVRCTAVSDGDLSSGPGAEAARRAVVDLPWTTLRQVHGADVVRVATGGDGSGRRGDGLVAVTAGVALAVLTADCAPVAMASPEGVLGVAHAGWRGLTAGVVEATADAMRASGASWLAAVVGPCIHRCCYSFGAADLAQIATRLGPTVVATDRAGRPALDVPAAVRVALGCAGVTDIAVDATCTACSPRHWSWRARGDQARQATVVWRS